MKKVLSIVLAIAMIATMSAVAFAADKSVTAVPDSSTSIEVGGVFSNTATTVDAYKVDLEWNAISFTYTDATISTWDTATHKWVNDANGTGWAANDGIDTVTINVENHSSKKIKVACNWTDNGADNATTTVTYTDDKSTVELAAPAVNTTNVENPAGTKDTISAKVAVSGTIAADASLGSFALTVSAA